MPKTPGEHALDAIRRLKCEYEGADALLLGLACAAHISRPELDWPTNSTADDATLVVGTMGVTISCVRRWNQPTPGIQTRALYAAGEALAGVLTAGWNPVLGAQLSAPWDSATAVRTRLHELGGRRVEAVATRLLPTWAGPIEDLPTAAASVTEPQEQP